ncbi:unnamed protein product, partial [Ascophyllum nodosum]
PALLADFCEGNCLLFASGRDSLRPGVWNDPLRQDHRGRTAQPLLADERYHHNVPQQQPEHDGLPA